MVNYYWKRVLFIKLGDFIDYKDVELFKKYIIERGKIMLRRIIGLIFK